MGILIEGIPAYTQSDFTFIGLVILFEMSKVYWQMFVLIDIDKIIVPDWIMLYVGNRTRRKL